MVCEHRHNNFLDFRINLLFVVVKYTSVMGAWLYAQFIDDTASHYREAIYTTCEKHTCTHTIIIHLNV